MTRRLSAFSLIEVAIALIVMGIITGFAVPLITSNYRLAQHHKTDNHREQIVAALAGYVLKNNRLPSPALTTQGIGAQFCDRTETCVGYVPFTILGLPEKTAKDGYGNWFTYAVNPKLTNPKDHNIQNRVVFCSVSQDIIKIRNIHDHHSISVPSNDPIAFVLISHGPNGSGALTDQGDRTEAVGLEEQNSQPTFEFVEGQAPNFDHQVFWITRNNLMAFYAKKPCDEISPSQSSARIQGTRPNLSGSFGEKHGN